MTGFVGELIHSFNKNESAIHESDYFKELNHRENVILLGDSLGDLNMAEGAKDAKHILKIGFLNDHNDKVCILSIQNQKYQNSKNHKRFKFQSLKLPFKI